MTDTRITFDHIHLISKDPAAAASWYVEKLGGEITDSFDNKGTTQYVVTLEGLTLLIRGRRPGEASGGTEDLQWDTNHFGFHVDGDFEGFCDTLRQQGVPFILDPVDYRPGLRIAFIAAPDNVKIELLQRTG